MEKRLILAIALSAVVLLGWNLLFPPPEQPQPVPADPSIALIERSRQTIRMRSIVVPDAIREDQLVKDEVG